MAGAAATAVSTDLSLVKTIMPGDSVRIQENIPATTRAKTRESPCVLPHGFICRI